MFIPPFEKQKMTELKFSEHQSEIERRLLLQEGCGRKKKRRTNIFRAVSDFWSRVTPKA